ncbi:MAG: NAD(P)/FAD-dependent oxidoreductase [Halobacteriota archaeon]
MTEDAVESVEHRRLIIAGSGISGLSAAIYAARSNNDPLVFEGDEPGGQLTLTTDVENYPGFPEGISGPELINNMKQQAEKFGAELQNGIIESVSVDGDGPDRTFRVELRNGDVYTADAFVAASGASARTLDIPGQEEMMGYGLSTCATCDGAFFRDQKIMVIGGGDAAMEEANFLTKFASTVYLVHRREEFRAEDVWIDRTMEKVDAGEIEIMRNTEAIELHGSKEEGMESVTLVTHPEGHPTDKLDDPETEQFEFDVGAVFYAIGHTPNTDYLKGVDVETDADGYLVTEGGRGGGQTKTGVEGLFGAGDVVDFYYQQAVTAAGMGSQAAIDADEYLEELDRKRAAATTATAPAASSDD